MWAKLRSTRSPRRRKSRCPRGPRMRRRVGLQRGRINGYSLPLDQAGLAESLEHPGEDVAMGLKIDQAARPRNRRMIRRGLGKRDTQKIPERQRVRRPPRNGALRIEPLEVSDQQQSEIDPR